MQRVVIAIDDPLLRLGLQAVLDESDVAQTVANLTDASEIESALDVHQPDILLLDVRHRWADPELIPGVKRRHPSTQILMYVQHRAEDCILRHLMEVGERSRLSSDAVRRLDECCLTSLRIGARGCIPKEAAAGDVVRAVEAMAAGDVAAAPWLQAIANGQLGGGGRVEPSRAITSREVEVMALLADGLGNKAIARRLGIKEQTVKNHISRIKSKLGVSNRLQIGLLADRYDLKLEDPDPSDRGRT